jgi:hypothetical protein
MSRGTLGFLAETKTERYLAVQDEREDTPQKRSYPPAYEKLVPIALITLAAVIVLLLLLAAAVLLNLLPGQV